VRRREAALSCVVLLAACAGADDWPRFRGPSGAGVSDAAPLPAVLGPKQNLLWRMEVPAGRSSPVVVRFGRGNIGG